MIYLRRIFLVFQYLLESSINFEIVKYSDKTRRKLRLCK